MGKGQVSKGYKKSRTNFIFDTSHDGRHEDRVVDDVHVTDVSLSSAYPGLLSLR